MAKKVHKCKVCKKNIKQTGVGRPRLTHERCKKKKTPVKKKKKTTSRKKKTATRRTRKTSSGDVTVRAFTASDRAADLARAKARHERLNRSYPFKPYGVGKCGTSYVPRGMGRLAIQEDDVSDICDRPATHMVGNDTLGFKKSCRYHIQNNKRLLAQSMEQLHRNDERQALFSEGDIAYYKSGSEWLKGRILEKNIGSTHNLIRFKFLENDSWGSRKGQVTTINVHNIYTEPSDDAIRQRWTRGNPTNYCARCHCKSCRAQRNYR